MNEENPSSSQIKQLNVSALQDYLLENNGKVKYDNFYNHFRYYFLDSKNGFLLFILKSA